MQYILQLNATPSGWRLFTTRKTDPKFATFQKKIFKRDNNTCQFCGFQAKQHQEIVNLDNNYLNNKASNLVTSCCFCTQCSFLESVGKSEYGGGILIYLPELTQNELNGLCHVLFCAMANATQYQEDAQNLYRIFTMRAKIVEKQLGEGMSNPALLGRMLIDADMNEREKNTIKTLKDLRLLPSRDKFSQQIADWATSAREELSSANSNNS